MTFGIDPLDPLLPVLAYQHDLRERFLLALEDIAAIEVDGSKYKEAFLRCKALADEAMDSDKIAEWDRAGRPLRGVDEKYGEAGKAVTEAVRSAFGIAPFNALPEND